jgi:glycerophosphoryl diester phosphodiesterase
MINKIKGIMSKVNLKIVILLLITYLFFFHVPNIYARSEFPLIHGAHRGSSVDYTENSIEAIQTALEIPDYTFIEFDIQYTKDKVAIVFHDNYLLRLQGKLVKISKLTYEELSDISEYHIPTYQEVMNLIKDKKRINIEIKSQGNLEDDKKLVDFVVQDCKERRVLDLVLLSSISPDVVSYISQKYPELKTGKIYLIHTITYLPFRSTVGNFYQQMDEIGADYIMLHGLNIKNYDLLVNLKPEDKTLIFWYFTDQMMIMQKDASDRLW